MELLFESVNSSSTVVWAADVTPASIELSQASNLVNGCWFHDLKTPEFWNCWSLLRTPALPAICCFLNWICLSMKPGIRWPLQKEKSIQAKTLDLGIPNEKCEGKEVAESRQWQISIPITLFHRPKSLYLHMTETLIQTSLRRLCGAAVSATTSFTVKPWHVFHYLGAYCKT